MRKFLQNKLWRDKRPAFMTKTGSIIDVSPLDDVQYDQQLRIKLLEEAAEVCAAQSSENLIEELADVYEVIDALCALHNIDKEAVHAAQKQKHEKYGGFYERKFVTIAHHPAGSHGEQYCLAQPEKYPEIE